MSDFKESIGLPSEVCPSCGSSELGVSRETDRFPYGVGKDAVTLEAPISVFHCRHCGLSYSGEDAIEARHDAVCAHLGVLNPAEVKAIREKYRISQSDFSEITKIGKASLARWETGSLVQNLANDNFLRLLAIPENFAFLSGRNSASNAGAANSNVIPLKRKFSAIDEKDLAPLSARAKVFQLFAQGSD